MGFLIDHWLEIGGILALGMLALVLVGILRDRRSQRDAEIRPQVTRLRVLARQPGHLKAGPYDDDASLDRVQGGRQEPPVVMRPSFSTLPAPVDVPTDLTKLDAQVATLEERLDAGLSLLRRRIEQLEQRVDGGADPSPYPQQLDTAFDAASLRAQPEHTDFVTGDAVISQPLALGGSGTAAVGAPAGPRVPVEVSGAEVSKTQSIPPEAWLVPQAGGTAQVSLNPEVVHPRYSLDRLATFFDLGDRREGAYRTSTPAVVSWDSHEQRGSLRTPGKAVAQ